MTSPVPAVLTAVAARWDGPVAAAVDASPELTIARRCADLADLLATAASGTGRVAVVSGQLRGLTLSSVATLRESGVEVVGLADPDDDQDERRLWQLGVHSVVLADAASDVLVAALLAAASHGSLSGADSRSLTGASLGWVPQLFAEGATPHAAESTRESAPTVSGREVPGRVIVVWGPNGAPGRTAVAVNLAVELAMLDRHVVLVDADTYGGCVAQTLALLDEAPGVAAAARSADQGALDVALLSRLLLEVRPGLRVLTGIPKADRWPEVRGAALERVLQVCRAVADDVVVDVGFSLEDDEELSYDTQAPRRNQATLTALQSADAAVVVGGCDPISLQRLVRGLQELGTVRAPEPMVVVNRLRSGPIGSPPARLVADALARFAGVTDLHTVPDDPAAFDAAMLAGRALAEVAPHSPARRSIAQLAGRLDQLAPIEGSLRRTGAARPGAGGGGRRHTRRWGRTRG